MKAFVRRHSHGATCGRSPEDRDHEIRATPERLTVASEGIAARRGNSYWAAAAQ